MPTPATALVWWAWLLHGECRLALYCPLASTPPASVSLPKGGQEERGVGDLSVQQLTTLFPLSFPGSRETEPELGKEAGAEGGEAKGRVLPRHHSWDAEHLPTGTGLSSWEAGEGQDEAGRRAGMALGGAVAGQAACVTCRALEGVRPPPKG